MHLRHILTLAALPILLFGQSRPDPVNDPNNPPYASGVVLIKIRAEAAHRISLSKRGASSVTTGLQTLDSLLLSLGVMDIGRVFPASTDSKAPRSFTDITGLTHAPGDLDLIFKIRYLGNTDAKNAGRLLSSDRNVEWAEPDYFVFTQVMPNDPLADSLQWYLDSTSAIKAPQAWNITTGDTTQIIGVIDTGVDWMHPDLAGKIWRNPGEIPGNDIDDDANGFIDDVRGWDWISNDNNPMDDNSHGTHVAGIAAAETNNNVGIAGISWGARIMPLKVLQSSGYGTASDVAAAVNYARLNGATILNLSLGTSAESMTMKFALENAYNNTVIVAAAGNSGAPVEIGGWPAGMYPACYPWVIGVMTNATFSNYDPSGPVLTANSANHNYEITAPGVSIYSAVPGGGYRTLNGTSMAAPIVSGAVALIKSLGTPISTEELFARLIQSAPNNMLDIHAFLTSTIASDLHYTATTLVDTLPGCDNDGKPDAGEYLQLYTHVKNAGSLAGNVYARLSFAPYEDTTTAIIVSDSSHIGNLSAYATLTGAAHPFMLYIQPSTANNRDVRFTVRIFDSTHTAVDSGDIVLKVQRGQELTGIMDSTFTLTPDKLWLINNSFRIGSNGILTIEKGTHLQINTHFYCDGVIRGFGTKDSMIVIDSPGRYSIVGKVNNWTSDSVILRYANIKQVESMKPLILVFDHCIIEDVQEDHYFGKFGWMLARDCIFRFSWLNAGGTFERNIFDNCHFSLTEEHNSSASHNIFTRSTASLNDQAFNYGIAASSLATLWKNSFLTGPNSLAIISGRNPYYDFVPQQYWGTTDSSIIARMIYDFWDQASLPILNPNPILTSPSDSAHGCVWNVYINDVNLDSSDVTIGSGPVKFDVTFNRGMKRSFPPWFTFGVREPYTQHLVEDSASWNPDSTRWTAYYRITPITGDGINTVRIVSARDSEDFEMPIEDQRFRFTIQSAGSLSNSFMATAGVGKIMLEWPADSTNDLLGYNLYRSTDSLFTNPVLVKPQLITASHDTDFAVVPNVVYYYRYKIVRTDMSETDYSKQVYAVPDTATKGDANGDGFVDVLDVVTVVRYIQNQEPQPFLFDAADKNNDLSINVLDIVGIINKILGRSPKQPRPIGFAEISFDSSTVEMSGASRVSALQIRVVVAGLRPENIIPGPLLRGMEYSFRVFDDTLCLVAYNLWNSNFSIDNGTLFSIEGAGIVDAGLAIGANSTGGAVGIHVVGRKDANPHAPGPSAFSIVHNYPNPFTDKTTILFGLPEDGMVTAAIFTTDGRAIRSFQSTRRAAGYQELDWDGRNDRGESVAAGVYQCRISYAGRWASAWLHVSR